MTGVPPSGSGLRPFGVEPRASQAEPLVPNAGDGFENDTQRGYAAWERGEPFDKSQSAEWVDGWKTADDFAWWKRFAASLGGSVHGFSHRHSGTLIIGGEYHQISGKLLAAVDALATAASGQDAEERLEAKPGKAAREAGNAQPGAPHDQ